MRKSGRESKKPEFLTFAETHLAGKQKLVSLPEEVEDDDENRSTTSESAEGAEIRKPAAKTAAKSAPKIPKDQNREVVRRKPKAGKAAATSTIQRDDWTLFEFVEHEEYEEAMTGWLDLFKTNRISAINQLVNLCLRAAGSNESWIAEDVDLEPLGAEEIDQLLEEQINAWAASMASKVYPLIEKGKGRSSPFLVKFQQFWETFLDELLTSQTNGRYSGAVKEFLRVLIDILTTFSSISVANIRDAVSEALLSIASSMTHKATQLKTALITSDRQLNSLRDSNDSAKVRTVQKQIVENKKELQDLANTIDSIFSSIFMHRSRDSVDDIRNHVLLHLIDFIMFDIDYPVKKECLKYLGWACSDPNTTVRLSAINMIKSLVEKDELMEHLQGFVEYFMDRFIEMAANDLVDEVSKQMIITLRVMQCQGYLDAVSEEKLDEVDVVIFAHDVSREVRKEAFLFLIDHTEGFDDPPELLEAQQRKDGGRGIKSGNAATTTSVSALQRKHVAIQLETLTEFAEHHLRFNNWSSFLAEAVLDSHKADILQDWHTIFVLLMRETEELITTALRPNQISILITMFVTSAKHIHRLKIEEEESATGKKQRSAASGTAVYNSWEALNDTLQRRLIDLLCRFKDREDHVLLLTSLLPIMDLNSAKAFGEGDKVLQELLGIYHDEQFIRHVVKAYRGWAEKPTLKEQTCEALRSIAEEAWHSVDAAVHYMRSSHKGSRGGSSSRGSSSSSNGLTKESALVHLRAVKAGLCTAKVVLEEIPVHSILKLQITEFFEHAQKNIRGLVDIATARPEFVNHETGYSACADGFQIMITSLMWLYRDALEAYRNIKKSQEDEMEVSDELLQARDDAIEALLNLRDKLVEESLNAMNSGDENLFVRRLRLEGFHAVSTIRAIFQQQLKTFTDFDRSWIYAASEQMLDALRNVFESEEALLREEMSQAAENEETDAKAAQQGLKNKPSQLLIHKLLAPLSMSLVYDIEHLNRRQAAAVLRYILDPVEQVQDVVRAFAKRLKDGNVTKYAEVQLATLKMVFSESALRLIEERREAEQNNDEEFDFTANEALEEDSYDHLLALSRRLSSSLTANKAKGDIMRAMSALVRAGIDFALADEAHVGFAASLISYVRLLPDNEIAEVTNYFHHALDISPVLPIIEENAEAPTTAMETFFSFREFLISGQKASTKQGAGRRTSRKPSAKKGKATSSRSPEAMIHHQEEGEDDLDMQDFFPTTSRGKEKKSTGAAVTKKRIRPTSSGKAIKKVSPDAETLKGRQQQQQEPARRSSRSSSQRPVSYGEGSDEEDEDAMEVDEPAPLHARASSHSGINRPRSSAGSVPASSRPSRPSMSPALNLDVDDDDDEEGESEEETPRKKAKSSIPFKAVGRSPFPTAESPIGQSQDNYDDMDTIPSSRRRLMK